MPEAGQATVADVVGASLVHLGVDHVFGVVGSGNFHVTNAMVAAGARFVASRHEAGAMTMADAFARTSGRVAAVTVHQGCGLTNTMTGLAEAAKSRTPVVVLAAEVAEPRSNFYVDQSALATAVGAVSRRLTSAASAADEVCDAVALALYERRTVLLNLPLHLQAEVAHPSTRRPTHRPVLPPQPDPRLPDPDAVEQLVDALERSERPVFIAGRGSRGPGCREALERLAADSGTLLATSAVARGLFRDSEWSLDIAGGFASPAATRLIAGADLIVGWGCALNMWTTAHGTLVGPHAVVAQVDHDEPSIGAHRRVDIGVVGDVLATATATSTAMTGRSGGQSRTGFRTAETRQVIERGGWSAIRQRGGIDVDPSRADKEDRHADLGRIDPRTLTALLDAVLPAERVVAVDSGNFMGYPSTLLSVPDEQGFCFTQAFQSIGLGLATAIGAALARPDRLPVAAVGDGGLMMSAVELDTVRRLGLPMVVVVYNDDAYGAEVHHFGPDGHPLDTVRFPPTDIAGVARGYGFEAVTVRSPDDLAAVAAWVAGPRRTPLLVDAKVTEAASWWLEQAFRGH